MTGPSPAPAAVPPPPPQPPASTVLAVARVASFVRGAVERRVLEPAGMSWSAFAALAAIVEAPEPIRMHVVAEATGMAQGTTRSAVTRLEDLGLVSRNTPSRDHRQVELIATRSGHDTAQRLRGQVGAVEQQLIADPRTRHVLLVAAARVRPYPRRGHRQGRGA